jgi:hypothetical protein
MPTVRLDKKIAGYIQQLRREKRFRGHGSRSRLLAESIRYFLNKHQACFTCKYHKDQVVGLILGRQKVSLEAKASGKSPQQDGAWLACPKSLIAEAQELGKYLGMTGKQVMEQAVLEHITRPSQCDGCPFYDEMKKTIEAKEKPSPSGS